MREMAIVTDAVERRRATTLVSGQAKHAPPVAVAWQHASAGDWTNYAADVSRRTRRQDVST